MKSLFVIGGAGQIGLAAAHAFLRAGWRVTVAGSGRPRTRAPIDLPDGVGLVEVDRRDTAALRAALGSGVDAVIDTVAFSPRDADQLAGLAGLYGSLAVISSASVYADADGRSLESAGDTGFPHFPAVIAETQPTVEPGQGYSAGKVALERRLLETATRPLTIVRPCAIHGVGCTQPREYWFVKRMLDHRRTIPLAAGGRSVFHTTATANLAALLLAAFERPATRILNAGDPNPPDVRTIGETIAARLGWDGEFAPQDDDSPVGHTPWSAPRPLVVSMAAAEAIGYRPAGSYAETVAPFVDWLKQLAPVDWRKAFPGLAAYPSDIFDYAAEDAALTPGS
jgi:nucleoside-diphosphate-sugar epimerase